MIFHSLYVSFTGILTVGNALARSVEPTPADQHSLGPDDLSLPLWKPSPVNHHDRLVKRATPVPGTNIDAFSDSLGEEGFWYDRSKVIQGFPTLEPVSDDAQADAAATRFLEPIEAYLSPSAGQSSSASGIEFTNRLLLLGYNNYVLAFSAFGNFQTVWPTTERGGQLPLDRQVGRNRPGDLGFVNLREFLRDRLRIIERAAQGFDAYSGVLAYSRGNFGIYWAVYDTNSEQAPPDRAEETEMWFQNRIELVKKQEALRQVLDASRTAEWRRAGNEGDAPQPELRDFRAERASSLLSSGSGPTPTPLPPFQAT
ncbi:MAG: hypothetical protein M1831_000501 [Alyxoria varia]|nr:MAG: hypothetical protein M1831_000501 [Alyxoria varia]